MNVFIRAAKLIERDGWTQNPSLDDHGPKCIGLALGETTANTQEYSFIRKYLWERYGEADIPSVNDYAIQSQSEAIAVLREVARRWETR